DDIRRCSLPVSSAIPVVQIAAKLYITTDKVRDVETSVDIDADDRGLGGFDKLSVNTSVIKATGEEPDKLINNEVFEVCDDYAFLDFSNKPDGGSREKIFEGKDGTLELFY
ncbi:hypothetical protein Tco_0518535, partial [Tanacetum coccineum]